MIIKDYQENYGNGWIKVYRSLQKHWIWENPLYFQMWIDFLLRANHRENKFLMEATIITIKRGEFITSQLKLAQEYHTSRSKIRKFLDLLEKDFMIEQKTTSKFTKIIICNYDTYQDTQPTEKQQKANGEPAEDPQKDTNKNDKNVKNDKKYLYTPKSLEERMTDFELAVMEYKGEYPVEMLQAFWEYWSEPNQSRTKMKKELQKTWDTKRRLKTWANNEKNFKGKNGTNKSSVGASPEFLAGLVADRFRKERN